MQLLEIKNLHARIAGPNGREILKGVDLTIKRGEVHAIMGKNGSGKSTLAQVLMGREAYEVTGGTVTYNGKDLLDLSTEERAREGVFLAFQYPVEIPGVSTSYFLKASVNAIRKYKGQPELDAMDFLKLVRSKMELLKMDKSFMNRAVNEGFSGGEKKRNEVFQMAVCDPTLCLMDETDSGLDIDALKIVSDGVNALRRHRGEPEVDAMQFLKLARARMKELSMPEDMLKRGVNVGFSGGEKKRNEVLQMALLGPKLAILDETDSGLDIDALKIVSDGVNALRGPNFSALIITHYQRLLDYIVPDRVHVLMAGKIVRSGGPELAHELEAQGYAQVAA